MDPPYFLLVIVLVLVCLLLFTADLPTPPDY